MTADIQLYREDTGEMAAVRVVDGHTPARAASPTHMDVWDAIERRAADEFAAWVEGETARAKAEMRALCDELGLPRTWAVLPEPVPDRDAILAEMVRVNRPVGWTPTPPVLAGPAPDDSMPGREAAHPTPTGPPSENPYCMRCGKHLGKPFHETNEHDEAAANSGPALPNRAQGAPPEAAYAGRSPESAYHRAPGEAGRYRGPRSRIGRWADETLKRPGKWWRARKAATDKRMGLGS